MIQQLPDTLITKFTSGDAHVGLALSPDGGLLPILHFTDITGAYHVIELLPEELPAIGNDVLRICQANRDQIGLWRLELEYAI